jgi:predicted AAA+ superfamily ATPase
MFLRDSGLLHALLNRHSITDIARDGVVLGHSWEGFCIENLIEAAPGAIPYFYRDDQQNEIDLVLDFGEDRRLAIEIKSESARISDGFDSAVREIRPIDSYVVRPIDEGFTDGKNRRIVGLLEMIGIVRSIASRSVLAAH